MEIIILGAIAIELFALYNHSKLDKRIDEHIKETNKSLTLSNGLMKMLDNHMIKFDEHMTKTDEHISQLDTHIARLDEHTIKLDNHMQTLLNNDLSDKAEQQKQE
ncbi:MAG: hypothetical protein JSV20_02820 [Candidatus Bathyarchaeota archaeon]|nr:MAG: hypothetical protein JSV20_02820 [Candidatus Bathyarchaeota archaeon]